MSNASSADLLAALWRSGETVSVSHQKPGDKSFPSKFVTLRDGPEQALSLIEALKDEANVFHRVNPVRPGLSAGKRGSSDDVTRWAALVADLDWKDNALPDLAAAEAVIADLSAMFGTEPSFVTNSGGGLHPYWFISGGELDSPEARAHARALLARFGRLVNHVARKHGAKGVDNVFDLARVLRTPGTFNMKPKVGVEVTVEARGGRAVTVDEVAQVLHNNGIAELRGDRDDLGDVVAPLSGWNTDFRACGLAATVVDTIATDQPKNGRHFWAYGRAIRLVAARRLGCLDDKALQAAQAALQARLNGSRADGLRPGEAVELFWWARDRVSRMDDERLAEEHACDARSATEAVPAREVADFWQARPTLAALFQWARARRASPWAVLGGVLARVVAAMPPAYHMPPLIGGNGSLNLFVALVAPSGGGKGAAQAVADAALVITDPIQTPTRVTIGSGEGIAHAYRKRNRNGTIEWRTHSVLFDVGEVDTLAGIAGRSGTTLLPELCKAYSGETLGFQYAAPAKCLPVPAHEYRLAMIVGVQPGRGRAILDHADSGLPQRFVFLPATDPDMPDVAPPAPDPISWRPPRSRLKDGGYTLDVCGEAKQVIDSQHLARARGAGDALDGHAILTREKIAAALGLLDGRLDVNPEDWSLAGVIQAVSDHTRAGVKATLDAQDRAKGETRAKAAAHVAVRTADAVADSNVQRVARWAKGRLAEGEVAHSDL